MSYHGGRGRDALLEGLERFSADHGLLNYGNVELLIKKFLVVSANAIDLKVAYPMISNDMDTLLLRVGSRSKLYRGTNSSGYTYAPEMWQYLFSNAGVEQLASVKTGGSSDVNLEGFRHFVKTTSQAEPKFRRLPLWKKALAFYMAAQVHRNAHKVCDQILGVENTLIKREAGQLRQGEFSRSLAALVQNMSFAELDQPEINMTLKEAASKLSSGFFTAADSSGNRALYHRGYSQGGAGSAMSVHRPWDAPSQAVADVVSAVQQKEAVPWTLAVQRAYRKTAAVKAVAAFVGDFAPLSAAFQKIVSDAMSEDSTLAVEHWAPTLSLIDYAPVDAMMKTGEMQTFLHAVANEISISDYEKWDARGAVKKLLTIHTPRWEDKWKQSWVIDEPLRRAVATHLKDYPRPTDELKMAIMQIDPEGGM